MRSLLRAVPVVFLCAASAGAQSSDDGSTSTGLGLGLELMASVMQLRNVNGGTEAPSGAGFRASAAYGFGQHWSVIAGAHSSRLHGHTVESLKQLDVGARYTFADDDAAIRPFLEGSIAGRTLRTRVSVKGGPVLPLDAAGNAIQLAGGAALFNSRHLAMEVSLAIETGSLGRPTVDGDKVQLYQGTIPATNLRIGGRYWLGNR